MPVVVPVVPGVAVVEGVVAGVVVGDLVVLVVVLVPVVAGVVVAVCWSPQAASATSDTAHINRTIMSITPTLLSGSFGNAQRCRPVPNGQSPFKTPNA